MATVDRYDAVKMALMVQPGGQQECNRNDLREQVVLLNAAVFKVFNFKMEELWDRTTSFFILLPMGLKGVYMRPAAQLCL